MARVIEYNYEEVKLRLSDEDIEKGLLKLNIVDEGDNKECSILLDEEELEQLMEDIEDFRCQISVIRRQNE